MVTVGIETSRFERYEKAVVKDSHLVFTLVSFFMILVVFLNQVFFGSVVVGAFASSLFFLINVVFLGHSFFEDEDFLVRFLLGGLVLFVFVGLVGWVVMVAYDLDVWLSCLVLVVVAGFSSFLNRRKRVIR